VAAGRGTGFNINSPKQLAFLLFEKLGFRPSRRRRRIFHGREVLERLKDLHEIPSLVLEYRTVAKIRSTYVDVLPGGSTRGWADPHDALPDAAATGRLSSPIEPAEHTDPYELGRRIRRFVAERGTSS